MDKRYTGGGLCCTMTSVDRGGLAFNLIISRESNSRVGDTDSFFIRGDRASGNESPDFFRPFRSDFSRKVQELREYPPISPS
jgi:hypothetical protein